ncbi:MAG: sulfatase [Verrucomicrobiota bacterium]
MKLPFIFCLSLVCIATAAEDKRPNLLFVIADDCTFRDIGTYGGQAYTPNMDRLASEGMKFDACFQTAPMCSPTRHTLYTGLYPVKSGAWANHTFAHDHVKSIVHYLRPLGYRVALSGKSHVAPKTVFPFEYSRVSSKKETVTIIDFEAVDSLLADSAKNQKPFALFACSNEPHTPWTKGKKFRKRYDAETLKLRPYMVDTPDTRKAYVDYLAEISFYDQEVGRLLDLLEKHGHAEDTLVMVVSEQGNNFPFAKWTCYDAGLQSAMLVRWPGRVNPGTTTDAMVEYVDVTPTFVEAAGGTPAAELDGKSFLEVLEGKTEEHKSHVFGLQTSRGIYSGPDHYGIRSIRDERYKLILNIDPDATFSNTINRSSWFKNWQKQAREGNQHAAWVVGRFANRPALEFYDLDEDPHEIKNLADDPAQAERIATMKKKLQAWMDSQGDEGQETEMASYTRMLSGNNDYKAWIKENGDPNKHKRSKNY